MHPARRSEARDLRVNRDARAAATRRRGAALSRRGSRALNSVGCSGSVPAMEHRPLGRTGFNVSSISFGAWAIGGTWGSVDDRESLAALHRALDVGVNFFDTADVYGDGRSERL